MDKGYNGKKMRILYVAPRFHPNMYPIANGLVEKGNEVCYMVHYIGVTENHKNIKVKVVSPSWISSKLEKHYLKKSKNLAEGKMLFMFRGKRKEIVDFIFQYRPDIVILRNRNLFSLQVYKVCKRNGVKKIFLYNLSPIYTEKNERSIKEIFKIFWRSLFPQTRITACRYRKYPEEGKRYFNDKNAVFMPFVPRDGSNIKKKYSEDGIYRIFDSGKFREYKNHFLVVDAVKILQEKGYNNLLVTIQGQAENEEEQDYFNRLQKKIDEYGLSHVIMLKTAVPFEKMLELFNSHDIYILASSRELGTVTILDAMALGLATISTNENGTADYITPGITGQVFLSCNAQDLANKIEIYLKNPELIISNGKASQEQMNREYNFESYYRRFLSLLEEEKGK